MVDDSLRTAEERICVLEDRFKNVNKAAQKDSDENPEETKHSGERRVERVLKAMAGDCPNWVGR